ncbi:Maf family protein [Alkalimonas collagenimarina]|uniref:7-methyl-GTP pyrophosphatase n=1 Tax=Alkalimonas collagenimarina TaxID=400390 RepID=A0ABT9H1Z7_9GAMM|nr:Maf family protein [Alkalimonas collagenimarina]MDP4537326.1 Maf family protein [Alkalimonas collagenimarina]
MSNSADYTLWLASTSPYRQQLLKKTGLHFTTAAPNIDESALAGETPSDLVQRLAVTKALKVAESLDAGLVIGSDQVAVFGDSILGKPHTEAKAIAQLQRFSGHKVTFLTGLALINAADQSYKVCCEPFHVHFRQLSNHEIKQYITLEQPLDCAGSFKSEGLGISLFEKLEGDDPNSLIGLPLIRLLAMLRQQGINPLC